MLKKTLNSTSEKIIINPITIKLSSQLNELNNQYSLKENMFTPPNNSPPNDFMIKLCLRMNDYKFFNINVDNLDSA